MSTIAASARSRAAWCAWCVEVGALQLPLAPPDAGGVDEPPGLAAELDQLVHRVPGGARHRVDEHPLLPRQPVEQGGLAHVRPADERDPARPAVAAELLGRRLGQRSSTASSRSPLPRPCSADTGWGSPRPSDHSTEASSSSCGLSALFAARIDRLAGTAQHRADRLVGVGDPDRGVHHEHDHVGELGRDLRLLGDAQPHAGRARIPPAGVDEGEPRPPPGRLVGDPVAGDAGHVLHHRLAAADDPVDERGLADVRAAHDRDDRQRPGRAAAGPVALLQVGELGRDQARVAVVPSPVTTFSPSSGEPPRRSPRRG